MKNIIRALMLATIILFTSVELCYANDSWEMNLNCSPLPRYLDYPNASIKDLVKLSASYKIPSKTQVSTPYETLFYSSINPIGCTRYNPLNLMPTAGGIIRVTNGSTTPLDANQAYAIANASGRLFLDLYVKKCPVYQIIVPQDSFDIIVGAFYQNGFHKPDGSTQASIMLNIGSEPAGFSQTIAY